MHLPGQAPGCAAGTEELKSLLILLCLAAWLSLVSREQGQGIPTPGMSEVQAVHVLQATEAADLVA